MKLNEVLRLPEKIPCDKRLHFILGVVFTAIALPLFGLISLILLLVYAWGIEVYQLRSDSGKYDNFDAIAVVIGGIFVIIPYILK